MPVRQCAVSYLNDRQTRLTFVEAESVYEAAALAASTLGVSVHDAPFTVTVGDSDKDYTVTLDQVRKWAGRATSKDIERRRRVRELLRALG